MELKGHALLKIGSEGCIVRGMLLLTIEPYGMDKTMSTACSENIVLLATRNTVWDNREGSTQDT
jgi:hypothetical protein